MRNGDSEGTVPIVCPNCRDLVSVDGELADVRPGDPISAFCGSCERTIEVAAPVGIDANGNRADAVEAVVTEFPGRTPSA